MNRLAITNAITLAAVAVLVLCLLAGVAVQLGRMVGGLG